MPLAQEDYYWGKYTNASAAVKELNTVKTLTPGERVELIGDNYLTFDKSFGYVKPGSDYYYASGVCWTMSTYGMAMDEANKSFEAKYDMPLFVFEYEDRIPHSRKYTTYTGSNTGNGYTVAKGPNGPAPDYKFTVNPELAEDEILKQIRVKIVLNDEENTKGYNNQNIGAEVFLNQEVE